MFINIDFRYDRPTWIIPGYIYHLSDKNKNCQYFRCKDSENIDRRLLFCSLCNEMILDLKFHHLSGYEVNMFGYEMESTKFFLCKKCKERCPCCITKLTCSHCREIINNDCKEEILKNKVIRSYIKEEVLDKCVIHICKKNSLNHNCFFCQRRGYDYSIFFILEKRKFFSIAICEECYIHSTRCKDCGCEYNDQETEKIRNMDYIDRYVINSSDRDYIFHICKIYNIPEIGRKCKLCKMEYNEDMLGRYYSIIKGRHIQRFWVCFVCQRLFFKPLK